MCSFPLSHSEGLILQALVARLNDGTGVNANNGIISGVLVTVGDLARVVGIFGFSPSWCYLFIWNEGALVGGGFEVSDA